MSWFVNKAIEAKLHNLNQYGLVTHSCYDALIFNKIKLIMGGKVTKMITASAPLASDVLNFLRIAFCCDLREGYGMTESGGASCATFDGDPVAGHVGGPLAHTKLRLRDIPEMNYYHTNSPP